MRRNEVLVYVTGALLSYCVSTCTAYDAFAINYNDPNITCGNLTCYGPYTVTCNETLDKPCDCKSGYEGDECLLDLDECNGHIPCGGAGFCINTIGSFRCNCVGSWTGDHCNNDNGGPIECIPGWTGLVNCRTDIDECKNALLFTCPMNYKCKNARGNYTCICDDGWNGTDCMQDINECEQSPCQHSGTCTNTQGSYQCRCTQGWNGTDCSMKDFCQTSPCMNKGICHNEQTGANCSCAAGWTGETCEVDVDECKSKTSPCMHYGNCTNNEGSYLCRCSVGWDGHNCEQDVDECSQNASLCVHESTCINTNGSYICKCSSGFEGRNCETDKDECQYAPCLNNGTCNNTIGSFNCACAQNYTGTYCEQDPYANSHAFSGNSGSAGDHTTLIVGPVLGSVAAVGAAVFGVFLYKKFRRERFNKTHTEFSSDDLHQGKTVGETPTMPGQTKFHVK